MTSGKRRRTPQPEPDPEPALFEPELRLTTSQRKLIADETMVEDGLIDKLTPVRVKGRLQPVRLSPEQWDDLAACVLGAAGDHDSGRVARRLQRIGDRICREVFGEYEEYEDSDLEDDDPW